MKPNSTEEHVNQVPYYLDKINAIQKKLDSTFNQTSTIEVKGTTKNPQIVIVCNTAAFEWIKTSLANFLKTKDIEGVCSKLTVDKSGACISVSKKLKKKEKKVYTINFFNTTSTILVNGNSDINYFMAHYEELMSKMPHHVVDAANQDYQSICHTALASVKNYERDSFSDESNMDTSINSPSFTHSRDEATEPSLPTHPVPSTSSNIESESSKGLPSHPTTPSQQSPVKNQSPINNTASPISPIPNTSSPIIQSDIDITHVRTAITNSSPVNQQLKSATFNRRQAETGIHDQLTPPKKSREKSRSRSPLNKSIPPPISDVSSYPPISSPPTKIPDCSLDMCKALNKSLQSRIQELEEVVNNQAKIIQQMQESRNIGPLTNDTLRAHLSHFSETMEQKFNHQLFCVKQQLESSINQKFGTYAEVAGKTQSHDTGAHVSPFIPTPHTSTQQNQANPLSRPLSFQSHGRPSHSPHHSGSPNNNTLHSRKSKLKSSSKDQHSSDHPQSTHREPFAPERNIIVNIEKDSAFHLNYNQDITRQEICKHYGLVIVEKITPYKFKSDHPKLAIQFRDTAAAIKIVTEWNCLLFGGSTARRPQDPKTQNLNCAMMYNVPKEGSNNDIERDIKAVYPEATIERLSKGGKTLRTVKVKFASQTDMKHAIHNGIPLKSLFIYCHLSEISTPNV
jgi:hypothetical protein